MFTKSAIFFFELVFFFNTIKYDTVDAAGQDVTVQVWFLSTDQESVTFIKDQLAPEFECFSKCIKWDFHPLYPTGSNGNQPSNLDKVFLCARHYYKSMGNQLAKFYVCMMTTPGDGQLSQGPVCASKSEIFWDRVKNCTPAELGIVETGDHLGITLNDRGVPNISTKFKQIVCNRFDSLNLFCACCH